MQLTIFKSTIFLTLFVCFSCGSQTKEENSIQANQTKTTPEAGTALQPIIVGAAQPEHYLNILQGKNIGLVANQTSVIEKNGTTVHLVDEMLSQSLAVVKVFAPEHGFRGKADAGEAVKDGVDSKTNIPIISLYGKNKKPSPQQLEGLDIVVFDIQDVGARFYTYISTLHYVMEACAEAGIQVMVFDRPNPNGHYVDGPLLEKQHSSFVGMHAVPVIHGMTIGEYAQMINGEGWLKNSEACDLTVIKMQNYTHKKPYSLPIKPSPNLPNDVAINLYPSLCFFEGTVISAGRGTDQQFQIFGAPSLPPEVFTYAFTPKPNEGAKYPKFEGKICHGLDLSSEEKLNQLNLEWLVMAYQNYGEKSKFFNDFFTKLAGTKKLQQQIEAGISVDEIRKSWQNGLDAFKTMRQPYMLYD